MTKKSTEEGAVLSKIIQKRILTRIVSTNALYRKTFSHFNSITGGEKTIPRWRCECREDRIRCELSRPYRNTDELSASTRSLVEDLQNLLVGTDLRVVQRSGELVIERRPGGD